MPALITNQRWFGKNQTQCIVLSLKEFLPSPHCVSDTPDLQSVVQLWWYRFHQVQRVVSTLIVPVMLIKPRWPVRKVSSPSQHGLELDKVAATSNQNSVGTEPILTVPETSLASMTRVLLLPPPRQETPGALQQSSINKIDCNGCNQHDWL